MVKNGFFNKLTEHRSTDEVPSLPILEVQIIIKGFDSIVEELLRHSMQKALLISFDNERRCIPLTNRSFEKFRINDPYFLRGKQRSPFKVRKISFNSLRNYALLLGGLEHPFLYPVKLSFDRS